MPSVSPPSTDSPGGALTTPSTSITGSDPTSRTGVPTVAPTGSGTGIDHQPSGGGSAAESDDGVSGSPARSARTANPAGSGTGGRSPLGTCRYSITDASSGAPAATSAVTKG